METWGPAGEQIGYSSGIDDLVQPLLASAPEALRDELTQIADLQARLCAMVAAARDTWGELDVTPAQLIAHIAARLPDDRPALAALESVRAPDLYLACACTHGSRAALAAFDDRYMVEIDIALARMRSAPQEVEEVKQLVRHKLFVDADGKLGKIREYSGRGDLRRWVRSIAVRTCLNQKRKGKREVLVGDDQVLAGLSAAGDDPELAYMKQKYKSEFRDAFLRALGELGDREQNLLRYHHVDRLNIDEIGAIYKIHRVTAYRWLEKARDKLVSSTQKQLRAQLNVEHRELDSILRLIRSQLQLSLVRYLGDDQDATGDRGGGDES